MELLFKVGKKEFIQRNTSVSFFCKSFFSLLSSVFNKGILISWINYMMLQACDGCCWRLCQSQLSIGKQIQSEADPGSPLPCHAPCVLSRDGHPQAEGFPHARAALWLCQGPDIHTVSEIVITLLSFIWKAVRFSVLLWFFLTLALFLFRNTLTLILDLYLDSIYFLLFQHCLLTLLFLSLTYHGFLSYPCIMSYCFQHPGIPCSRKFTLLHGAEQPCALHSAAVLLVGCVVTSVLPCLDWEYPLMTKRGSFFFFPPAR